ncbi:MAG TPA: hypothetical protein PLG94_15900 [Smithellaceae bacterium]|nr:hypothetical protein [Smithellaceae bacterium]
MNFTLACQPKDGRPYERGKDISVGQCWKWGCGSFPYVGCCKMCKGWPSPEYDRQCNEKYPAYCRGNCRGG